MKRQLDWFEKQLFGRKSEKRLQEDNPHQPMLNGLLGQPVPPLPVVEKETITYQRGKAKKQRAEDCVNDSGLRFGPEVLVIRIAIEAAETVRSRRRSIRGYWHSRDLPPGSRIGVPRPFQPIARSLHCCGVTR